MTEDYTGEWYLPQNENILSGILKMDGDLEKTTLELYSKIYFTGEEIISNDYKISNQKYFELILGGSRQKFTLYHCMFRRAEPIGESLSKLTYEVEFVFYDIHLFTISGLKIFKANIEYPFLSPFFDGWGAPIHLDNRSEQTVEYSASIPINEKLNLKIVNEYQKRIKGIDSGYEMKYSKSIQFEYTNGELLDDVFKDFYKVSKLLSFATNKDICFKINYFMLSIDQIESYDEGYVIRNNLFPSHIRNFSHHKTCDFSKKYLHQNFMFFSKWTFDEKELNNIIKAWFTNNDLRPIYDFYIDSNNWFKDKNVILSNVMYNNKFLNLVQGLESYYDILDPQFQANNEEFTQNRQEVINRIGDVTLGRWVNSHLRFPRTPTLDYKLDFLIQKFNDVITGINRIEPFIENYSIEAKEYRHKLSHGRIDKTYQGPNFKKIYSFSKVLLCFCILESLDIPNERIVKICKSNMYLHWEFEKIIIPSQGV